MLTEKISTLQLEYPQFTWRAASPADAERLHVMLLERDRCDDVSLAGTLESMRREFEDTWLNNIELDTLVALTAENEAAAFALIFANPEPVEKRQVYLWVEVHPAFRLPGLRRALTAWAVDRAEKVLDAIGGSLPRAIQASTQDKLMDRVEVYESLGFQRVRYFYHMHRDLSLPVQKPVIPSGLELITFRPEFNRPLMRAFNESFMDHWNFHPVTEEDWEKWFMGGEDFRPDLTYLVMDGDQIAAFSINGVSSERNAQRGLNEGWVHQLGTRRSWRKRGLATALLNASMLAFQREALAVAALGVDTANPTGALHVYENVGFVLVKQFIQYEIQLDGDGVGI
jgi:mycothiol synthase